MRGNGRLGLAALAAGLGEVLGAEGRRVLVVEPAALARRRRPMEMEGEMEGQRALCDRPLGRARWRTRPPPRLPLASSARRRR